MLPTTTETVEQLRAQLVAAYNALADKHAQQGRTDLSAGYRGLAAAVAAMRLGQ